MEKIHHAIALPSRGAHATIRPGAEAVFARLIADGTITPRMIRRLTAAGAISGYDIPEGDDTPSPAPNVPDAGTEAARGASEGEASTDDALPHAEILSTRTTCDDCPEDARCPRVADAEEGDPTPDAMCLDDLTRDELMVRAEAAGLTVRKNARKDTILDALREVEG